jgi:hypothetical protein
MKNRARGLSNLISLLGIGLVVFGGMALNQPEQVRPVFENLHISARAVYWIGWAEVLFGAMLAHSQTQKLGGLALTFWMMGAGAVHVRAGDLQGAGVPLALLLIGSGTLWLWRGTDWVQQKFVPTPFRRGPTGPTVFLFLFQVIGLSFLFRWAIGGILFWLSLPVLAWSQARNE